MKPAPLAFFLTFVSVAIHAQDPSALPGDEKNLVTESLEAGSAVLQADAPADALNIHLVGIHPMKDDPNHQMDTHHFCRQVNADFAQCALFSGSDKDAHLTGVEYIISEKLFDELPEEERQFWHPHNYEILSGTLVAPNLPDAAELELMEGKINSYGKTWHTWNSGLSTRPQDDLPLGEPKLAWSLNRDGEADPELLEQRQKMLEMELEEIRRKRAGLRDQANPQAGVNALKGQFGRDTQALEGVENK
ncbi:OBAP family protein [Marinobacter salicampi]|uniref:OBAP family protein n=1 Tax=Marinobacter salicampi TaxID=435907 RepID=UPI001A93F897|nr:OBAP family protein [Marinobacter salicampi]